jgi:hypothetical protein
MNRRNLFAAIAAVAFLPVARAALRNLLRGRVAPDKGKSSSKAESLTFLTEDGGKEIVTGDEFSMGQLQDPRLAGRLWELEGEGKPGGPFEIQKLFTIKDGKRYTVKYFCNVCNIYTYEPGLCMCCQDETVLQEIPTP